MIRMELSSIPNPNNKRRLHQPPPLGHHLRRIRAFSGSMITLARYEKKVKHQNHCKAVYDRS